MQLVRALDDIGLIRTLFLGGLIAFVVMYLHLQVGSIPNAYYVAASYLALLMFHHVRRRDSVFLRIHFKHYRTMLLAEYLALSTPLLVSLSYHTHWMPGVLFLSAVSILPFIPPVQNTRSLNSFIQDQIPNESFEWKAGMRRFLYIYCAVWLAGLLCSPFVGAVPVALFILGVLPVGFYEYGESLMMLRAADCSGKKFLAKKIGRQLMIFSIIAAPLAASFLVFHSETFYIVLIEFLLLISLHAYIVVLKYAFYQPDRHLAGIQVFSGIGAVGIMVPILLPLVWVMSVWFYYKSVNNLKIYLHDQN